MTLVPIIYTSLLIFSGLLLFVVIASYISFKLKSTNTLTSNNNHSQIKINRVQNYKPQPIYYSQQNYVHTNKNEMTKNELAINNKKQIYEKSNFNKTQSKTTKRIEIMNTNEKYKFNKPNNFVNNSKKENFRITDTNILDFYSDNNSRNYSTIAL